MGSRSTPAEAGPGAAVYPSLRDRVVVITGGGSGIGAVMVELFARQGACVAFIDRDVPESLALVSRLSADVPHVPLFERCDLTDIGALRAALGAIAAELGVVRVLINNAGSDDRHQTAQITPDYWDERMAVNLRHQFFAAQAVTPAMAAGGGSIINLSSIAWLIPSVNQAAYVTAKAGIVGLTRTLARELGPANIRVNCVLPGAIMTERQRRLWVTEEYAAQIREAQALKRELVPEDVVRVVLFLAADDSSAMTGQSVIVDGGWI